MDTEKVTTTQETSSWTDNGNDTITCDYCNTFFYKNDRTKYMRHCPYCGKPMNNYEEMAVAAEEYNNDRPVFDIIFSLIGAILMPVLMAGYTVLLYQAWGTHTDQITRCHILATGGLMLVSHGMLLCFFLSILKNCISGNAR